MKKQTGLTGKERLFCSHYARLGVAEDAAVRAGYPPQAAAVTGLRLLARDAVQGEIDRHREQQRRELEALALAGLRRIAFGPVNDAVALMAEEEPTPAVLAGLDLFGVSEIKRPRGGGWEVKFHDRLRALALLLDHAAAAGESESHSILEALNKGAAAIAAAGDGEPDDL